MSPTMQRPNQRPVRTFTYTWCVVIVCWMSALSAVWIWVVRYEFSTYRTSKNYLQQRWPSQTTLQLSQDRPTLVLFLHPRCPCTRATVRELDELLTGAALKAQQRPRILVLAGRPTTAAENWHDTDILRSAAKLPLAKVVLDPDGRESSRFGAVTSGTVMLFDTAGNRLFAGGVTASRGHEGDNAGSRAIRLLLRGQVAPSVHWAPAFGCRLCSPPSEQPKKAYDASRGEPRGGRGDSRDFGKLLESSTFTSSRLPCPARIDPGVPSWSEGNEPENV